MIEAAVEHWRVLPTNTSYQVSSRGRVRSRRRANRWRLLTPCKRPDGYMTVTISGNGKPRPCLVHRLVWETHRGPIPAGLVINHINAVRCDNALANLELVTQQQNVAHAVALGRFHTGDKHWTRRLNWMVQRGPEKTAAARASVMAMAAWNTYMARGEAHGGSKLTANQVIEIRRRAANKERQSDIAGDYGVSPAVISSIHRRKIWKHLP